MSALIRNQQICADDYIVLAEDAAPPESGKIIISLDRWHKEESALRSSRLSVGVSIPNTADVVALWPSLQDRPLIALQFPSFGDGRAYSQARILHDRCQYKGEIRATGAAVVRDQLHNMHRSGINAFALRADQDANVCLSAFKDFTLAYQPGADALKPVPALR